MKNIPLGEIIKLEYGKPLPREDRAESGKYPAYGANGIKARTDKFYIAERGIIVGRKGSAGVITLTDGPFWPLDVTYYVDFDKKKYDLEYIYWLLTTLGLTSLAVGVKPGISRNEVYALRVSMPGPLDEQRRVVQALNAAFKRIGRAAELTKKNLSDAQDYFTTTLVELFKKSDDWDEKLLSQVGVIERGKSKHRPRNDPSLYGGDYPFVQTGDIRNSRRIITDFKQTYNERGLAQSKLWPKGTLCITIAANIAETAILGFDACFPDSIIGFIPNEGNVKFYEYLITYCKDKLQAKSKGSAQDNINLGTFQSTPFRIPSIKEQDEIVAKLDAADASSQKLQALYRRKLESLAELKQSFLDKAFKGTL